jgi:hypothetical protein
MHAPDLTRQPYRRPPLARATDPQRMNWLWRLFCEVADIRPPEVVEALHALQIPVDQQRVRSWTVSDREDSFFPVSIAEVERNLRALVLLRVARRERDDVPPNRRQAAAPMAAADADGEVAGEFATAELDASGDESLAELAASAS